MATLPWHNCTSQNTRITQAVAIITFFRRAMCRCLPCFPSRELSTGRSKPTNVLASQPPQICLTSVTNLLLGPTSLGVPTLSALPITQSVGLSVCLPVCLFVWRFVSVHCFYLRNDIVYTGAVCIQSIGNRINSV